MRLVVTGTTGQVASALWNRAAVRGFDVIAVGRPEFDLSKPHQGLHKIIEARPDVIVSAAAYTAVDKAENDRQTAEAINVGGPAALANLAAQLSIPIVHLSTDYVFDGHKSSPYVETDPTNPLSVYGATKLRGEASVTSATPNHAILRTAWVYSPFGHNFLKTMLGLAGTRSEVRVVDDQRGNPTSAFDIADAVIDVATNLIAQPHNASLRGIFHASGTGQATWADFALEIFAFSASIGGPNARVARISTTEYPTVAIRPTNSCLLTKKLQAVHGVSMPMWQQSSREVIRRLHGAL